MLTIGEFSRLSRISPRMLRHYDALGLLRPAHTGRENGYRYYDESQLGTAVLIQRLSRYGFPLSGMGELLSLPEAELSRRIHKRRLEAYGELNQMREKLRQMEQDIIQMEGMHMLEERYQVILLQDPAQRVLSLRRTINVTQIHQLFQDLHRQAQARGLRRAGCTQLLYHGQGAFSYENMDAEAQLVVEGEGPEVTRRPPQLCAAVRHTGPYEELKYAYDALCAWIAQNPRYEVCGPAIERYLKDEQEAPCAQELETAVLFPVRPRS